MLRWCGPWTQWRASLQDMERRPGERGPGVRTGTEMEGCCPDPGDSQSASCQTVPWGLGPMSTPWFWTFGLENHERMNFCWCEHSVCDKFVKAATGNSYTVFIVSKEQICIGDASKFSILIGRVDGNTQRSLLTGASIPPTHPRPESFKWALPLHHQPPPPAFLSNSYLCLKTSYHIYVNITPCSRCVPNTQFLQHVSLIVSILFTQGTAVISRYAFLSRVALKAP